MARAFFYAGARALLVSHWEVGTDTADVKLTTSPEASMQPDELHASRAFLLYRLARPIQSRNARGAFGRPTHYSARSLRWPYTGDTAASGDIHGGRTRRARTFLGRLKFLAGSSSRTPGALE